MRGTAGRIEAVFDVSYLTCALLFGLVLLARAPHSEVDRLAGAMALVLVGGDAFHLVPRVLAMRHKEASAFRVAMGRGKQIASVTMTIFYLLLWQIGLVLFAPVDIALWSVLVYLLAGLRIVLCLLPQNRWLERYPPTDWAIWRNLPFLLQGALVAGLFFVYRTQIAGLGAVWVAVTLSFLCYLPVVLWSRRNPKVGMLMLPKTCAYLWILAIFLGL